MIANHVFEKELQEEVNHPSHYTQGKYEPNRYYWRNI